MELNNNLIGVQGVLVKCLKQTGDFTKINYRGGHEHHILYITTELASFLINKRLIEEKKVPTHHIRDVNEIVLFLALNTTFKRPVPKLEEFSHLMNITPQLSKCLLVNICFALGLIESYGFVIETFPLEVTEELLDQMIDCLRKAKLQDHLDNAFAILKSVVNKLSLVELSYKTEDTVDDIIGIATIILQNLTNITTEQAESMKALKIYQHMGYTLLRFFDLLLYTDESNKTVIKFIIALVSTTCNIIRCVTLNVFCSWAEINYEDQPLQAIIAGKAYLVMEKYQKNKVASELVSMLSTIARKPKTISERILEADVPAIIKMVNGKDEHQKLWFRALLNTQVFSNPKIVECIERWWQLSDESAVDRLLNLPLPKNLHHRQLIVKCASNLTLAGLTRILTIYFHREKFKWTEDITEKLILIFNQVQGNISEEELKQILLLILQNPKAFFQHFYAVAFKRSPELIQCFDLVKEIASIDNIGLDILMQVLDENIPTVENMSKYIQLFDTMVNCQYYTWDFMVSNLILTLINKYRSSEGTFEEFKCCLQVLKHFENLRCVEFSREIQLFEYILTCASENRCNSFLEFESVKVGITSCCVDYILHKCLDFRRIEGRMESFSDIGNNINDPWSNYYKNLFLSNEEISFVNSILPNLDLSNYKDGQVDENFTRLLKILPRCVPAEWKLLLQELIAQCQFSILLNVLSDIMILLCDFAESQTKTQMERHGNLLVALQFCLQNYGTFLVSNPNSIDDKILAINSLCRVLKHLPEPLKLTEGMSLINTLPEEALRSLAGDKEFIARIVHINDKQLCKALAQKVLSAKRNDS